MFAVWTMLVEKLQSEKGIWTRKKKIEQATFLPGHSEPCDGVSVKNTSDLLIFHFIIYLFEEHIKLFLDIVKRVRSQVVRLTLLPFHLPLLRGQLWLQCQRVCREAVTLGGEVKACRLSIRTNTQKQQESGKAQRLPHWIFFFF